MAKQNETAVRKVVAASLIGATIEWYDFFLYGVVAGIVFNKLYFPTGDPLISTMLAYTTSRWASSRGRWAGWCSATSACPNWARSAARYRPPPACG